MHGKLGADAVAGAMGEVAATLPQRDAGYGVDLRTARAGGKAQRRDADHALQHEREALAHLVGGLTDRNGAGDVSGAVLILAPGIEQEQLAALKLAAGGARDAIVHD